MQAPNKKQKTEPVATITFSDKDSKGIKTPHDDPLVITIKAGNFDVKRVLVNNGSSAEVLFYDAFKKMNILTDCLRKIDTPLYGFSNQLVAVEGIIALAVAIGTPPTQANFMLDFMVVKRGERRPDYSSSVLHGFMSIEEQENTHYRRPSRRYKDAKGKPVEDLVSIEVYSGEENKTVWIGSNLKEDTKLELVNLLRTYTDVFAWTTADMFGTDPKIITHRAVRNAKKFVWTDDCQKSFKELKTYLSSLPLLLKPFLGEDLFLYLSVTEVAASAILVREEDGVQKSIYYVSKVLQDVETRYLNIDKIALALIISARCLRPYFQSHTIIVLMDEPFRKVLLNPKASGRLNLYVDGSSAIGSSGAEIILISPKGFVVEYTLRFGFQTSNNEAEYEALLARIRLAHALKVDSLSVHSDSQLVVNHVLGDYEARDERMAQYLQLVKTSASKFKNFTICQIPRDQNTQANYQVKDMRRGAFVLKLLGMHWFTSVAHPQSNGKTENMNRSILQGLKKKLDEAKGAWVDELPKVLWAYRTTPHSVIGEMPFLLCYGTKTMLLVEIGVPTIQALHFTGVNNEVGLRANLDLVEEA
ncbi:hypothetical protein RJ639_030742 [Escallonia herrerae]|uniref:RNase H type-1 domain-containing protein n=1 Tax=Escallonia herrerae TaxID=1293975 RepID=A0AA88WXV5_9ASTE|nr:hypothetical protein RJ639_030742 [Escallonia herrerae]